MLTHKDTCPTAQTRKPLRGDKEKHDGFSTGFRSVGEGLAQGSGRRPGVGQPSAPHGADTGAARGRAGRGAHPGTVLRRTRATAREVPRDEAHVLTHGACLSRGHWGWGGTAETELGLQPPPGPDAPHPAPTAPEAAPAGWAVPGRPAALRVGLGVTATAVHWLRAAS